MKDDLWNIVCSASNSIKFIISNPELLHASVATIERLSNFSLSVSILYDSSCTNTAVRTAIQSLLNRGVLVKLFNNSKYNLPHGLIIIDANNKALGAVVEIDSSLDDYFVRYATQGYLSYIKIVSALFQSMWDQALEAVVLEPVEVERLREYRLLALLREVPQYAGLNESDISFRKIGIDTLFTVCKYVKLPSLRSIEPICYAYESQDIPAYEPCCCWTNRKSFLLLPPIIENHNGQLVIVDGIHRLFYLYAEAQHTDALCMVLDSTPNLPGKLLPFVEAKLWPRKLPREQTFEEHIPNLYRSFRGLEAKLTSSVFCQHKGEYI